VLHLAVPPGAFEMKLDPLSFIPGAFSFEVAFLSSHSATVFSFFFAPLLSFPPFSTFFLVPSPLFSCFLHATQLVADPCGHNGLFFLTVDRPSRTHLLCASLVLSSFFGILLNFSSRNRCHPPISIFPFFRCCCFLILRVPFQSVDVFFASRKN